MRHFNAAFILLLMFVISTVAAPVTPQEAETSLPFRVSSRVVDRNNTTLTLSFEDPVWVNVGPDYDNLQLAEFTLGGALQEEGYPLVPTAGRMFRLPPRSGVMVEVLGGEYETLTDIEYAASYSGAEGELDEEYGAAALIEDSWYPGVLADVSPPAIMHDFRVSSLRTYPVQVNTARHEVRVYSSIQVAYHFEGEDDRNALEAWPTEISEAFLPWYRLFLDWDDAELDEYTLYRGHIQVVLRNHDALMNLMQPWFEWKRQKGWILDLLTDDDVDWNQTAIRNELVARYETSDPKFDYVVVVGDAVGAFSVPPGSGNAIGAGDHGYSTLSGDDQLADVGIGRISLENTDEVSNYVQKVLSYERDPDMENTDWYTRGQVAVSAYQYGIGQVFAERYQRHAMLDIGYTQVDTAWIQPWGAGNVNVRTMQRFNDGISYYSCLGYIGAGLNRQQIRAMQNLNMTPVVIDITASTGNWANGLGTSEVYMRAEQENVPTGAIGAVGIATAGENPRFDHCLSGGSAFSMLVLRNPTLGDMHFGGKFNIWNNFIGIEDDQINNFNQWYNLMGDPTVWVWTDAPHTMDVEAADTIELGTNNYNVSVEEDGTPLESAWVTLYKVDDEEDVIARGVTDADGSVLLNAPVRYEGTAMLTITAQNFAPYRLEVEVVAPDSRIGYETIAYQDDGMEGTEGNGNSIPEAGETVGLVVTAKNFGISQQSNVILTAVSDDPWVENITGDVQYGTLDPDQSSAGDGLVLVEIASETQHTWNLHLNLQFSSDTDIFEDDFALEVNAPQLALVQVNGLDDFDPGDTAEITVRVKNVGGSDAAASSAELFSTDPLLEIVNGQADFPAIPVDQEMTSNPFTVEADSMTFPGHMANMYLVTESETGQVDTTRLSIPVGTRDFSDPSGPDHYGYYAFENLDTGYDQAPEFNWIEINPHEPGHDFNGTLLDLNDDDDDLDDAVVVDLPFTIQYYGEQFDQATVSSNGMMAMGSQADMANGRNFIIPSPLGPNYMIAPYWDERRLTDGGCVYTCFDDENNRFIVEWYQVRDYNDANPCTFEVVFYMQEAFPTYTGDNAILFQYKDVHHSQGRHWGEESVYYWTTGIENGDQTDGLLMAYWNQYSPGANAIQDGRAILFSTNRALITGTVEGWITDVETEEPIEGAQVSTGDGIFNSITDENGFYSLEQIIIGTYDIVVEAIGYNSDSQVDLEVTEDDTTIVNLALTHPEFHCDTDEITYNLPPGSQETETISISNTGNGDLDFAIKVLFVDPDQGQDIDPGGAGELDDPWDEYASFPLTDMETRNHGVTFFDDHFWVCGSNNADVGFNKLYRYNRDGEYVDVYDQPVQNHSSVGFHGITTDGEYLYGADRGRIYKMEYTGDEVLIADSWRIPLNIVHFITYDSDHDWIWIGHRDEPLYALSLVEGEANAEEMAVYNQNLDPQGLGYYPDDEDGFSLIFIYQSAGEEEYGIRQINPNAHVARDIVGLDAPGDPHGSDITNMFNPLLWTFMSVMDNGNNDYVQLWEIDFNKRWIDIEPAMGVIGPGGNQDVDITVYSNTLVPGWYYAWPEIDHNSIEQQYIIPLSIEILGVAPGEPHFAPVEPTGLPYSLIVEEATLDGESLVFGDEIGAFDGDLCVGAEMVSGDWPLPVVSWEGDPFTGMLGFEVGNPITMKIWSFANEYETTAQVDYVVGNGTFGFGTFSEMTISATMGNLPPLTIPIEADYFELISFNRLPDDMAAATIFDIPNLMIAYNDDGFVYIPPIIDTIGDVVLSEGYQVYCNDASELVMAAPLMDPATEYSLASGRWNWIGYPFDQPVNIETALTPIADNLVIVQTDDGGLWIPGVLNTLGDMEAGEGYFAFVNEDVTFQYNPGELAGVGTSTPVITLPVAKNAPPATGLPYVILARLDESLSDAAILSVYDGDLLVGKSVVSEDLEFTPVIAWGGNAERDVAGFAAGHAMRFEVTNSRGEVLAATSESRPLFGEGAYADVRLTANHLPSEFTVQQGYPNPFNPSVIVPFALPLAGEVNVAVFNVLGQKVFDRTQTYEAGYHSFVFDASSLGRELVSGVYFLKIRFNGEMNTQKLMLLR